MEGNSRGGLFAKAAKVFLGGEREPLLAQKASRYVCAQREAASSKDVYGEKQQKNRECVCV